MALIKSISGIRGTIGGHSGEGLTPKDMVKFCTAYVRLLKQSDKKLKIVIGRDARLSGDMVTKLVSGTLMGAGADVVDLGLSTTPTVEMAVPELDADGGIIITASHNPAQWNALKLLNNKGEFISAEQGETILELCESEDFDYAPIKQIGTYASSDFIDEHIQKILQLPLVDAQAISKANFNIVFDAVCSSGELVIPKLLRALGVKSFESVYGEASGVFPHNPEPLPEHLQDICHKMEKGKFDLGIVVDPDVDRLALVCENGSLFGEEYSLVAIADYVLQHKPGNTVSNLSSTQALKDVTIKRGGEYFASAVGEVNVVKMMKEQNAVIGGEGNGGIIYPELHYGRDALVGIALFLTQLAKTGKSVSALRSQFPTYHISKNKIELEEGINVDHILNEIKEKYKKQEINTTDGVKIIFEGEWVHLRKSNTEPIIRIYAEADSLATADHLANKIIQDIKEIITVRS